MVTGLRDRIIVQLRRHGTSPTPDWRTALTYLNTALSLIVGVEYPAAGIQRSALEQARDMLAQVLAKGL
jgi:hypothetical protein